MTPAMESALAETEKFPVLFLEGEFASGTVRMSTLYQDVEWNGETWTGAGQFVGIGDVVESEAIQAEAVVVSFSGVPVELVSLAINDVRQNLPGRCWLGLLQPDGTLIGDPIQLFEARLNVPEIIDGGGTCTIQITYDGYLVDLTRPRRILYTDEAQRALYPDDRGLEYIAAIQGQEIVWGRP